MWLYIITNSEFRNLKFFRVSFEFLTRKNSKIKQKGKEYMEERLQQVIKKTINEVSLNMCDNFCKYRDISNTDEDGVCDYVRAGNACPLDRLQ